MPAQSDPQYLQLYRNYAQAIQGFQNALAQRKRVRAQLVVKHAPAIEAIKKAERRPVGSPEGFRIPDEPEAQAAPAQTRTIKKVYLGPILGWAKLVGSSPEQAYGGEPEEEFDADGAYDAMSLKTYWNAKMHYERCKRAFFDYVRRQNVQQHRQQARAALDHAANVQLLGAESDDPLAEAKRELDAACRSAWALYQSSPTPKSKEAIYLLLEHVADAQLVGLESLTASEMQSEVDRMLNAGELSREK